jgi:hypothetical protein
MRRNRKGQQDHNVVTNAGGSYSEASSGSLKNNKKYKAWLKKKEREDAAVGNKPMSLPTKKKSNK